MSADRFFQIQLPLFRRALLGTTCLVGLALGSGPALAQALPVYNSTIFGTVDVTNTSATQQDIAASNIAGANFDSFDICGNCTVNINSEGSDALFVGVINSSGFQPTRILGALNSNARTVLRDANGFVFGRNSVVNVPGLVVTTGELDMNALENNQPSFETGNFGDSTITLRGEINIEEGGFAAFVAPHVRNYGVINARLGRVAMAAGEVVTVDMYGDNLISLAADPQTTKAIIENEGTIDAEGGIVQLSADAASATVDNLINTTGIIKTASATLRGGKIILSAGRVRVDGKLDAQGGESEGGSLDGGDINITSRDRTTIRDRGYLVTNAGGSVSISAGDDIRLLGPDEEEIMPSRSAATINTFGGDITFSAVGRILIEEDQVVDAGGGDIDFENSNGLFAARRTIVTEGEGHIDYEQVKSTSRAKGNTVQAAIDAVSNTGQGSTTLFVGEGEWNEYVNVSGKTIRNFNFYGAKAGEDARGAGEFTDGETVLDSAAFFGLNSLVVDGFYFGIPNPEGEIMSEGSPGVDGISVYDVGDVSIVNNIVRGYTSAGIYVEDSGVVEIAQNNLDGQSNLKGTYGVHLAGVNDATISNNDIANNDAIPGQAAIFIDFNSFERRVGGFSEPLVIDRPTPNVVISGNNLTNNSYGMIFETGNIDLTGDANRISGGEVGLFFAPPGFREEIPEDNAEFGPFDFEEFPVSELTLVDNTIGSTIFDGQSDFFVALTNGALFSPDEPTVLSGLDATYVTPFGTVTPSANGGFVSADQLAFLETKFVHFVDIETLGLFIFGGLESPVGFAIEDTYRIAFENFQANNPNPVFTILGLPNTGFNVGTRGFGLPSNLNNIAPAAGGNDASDLNDINPAAGGNEASCWEDAVNNAAQGNPSSYSMSSDPEDSLNAAVSCGAS